MAQDDLYHYFGLEDRSIISQVRKDKGSLWHMAKRHLLDISIINDLLSFLLES